MAISGKGDYPIKSAWFRSKTGFSRNYLLRTTPIRGTPTANEVFSDFFFNERGIRLVGYSTAIAFSATTDLSLTSLFGGIDNAAREGDLVVFSHFVRDNGGDQNVGTSTSGYTEIADLFGNDSNDANLSVSYKVMGSTPDTIVTSVATAGRHVLIASVWRGVDPTNPLDVTSTTSVLTNTGIADPASITPITPGAVVIAVGGNQSQTTAPVTGPSGYRGISVVNVAAPGDFPHLGVYHKYWSSGAEDPGAWTGVVDDVGVASAAITLALRPKQPAPITGTASITEADDTIVATATVRVAGSAAVTEEDDTVAATGTVGSAPITGTASITEADDTVAATATVRVAGTASITEGNDTVSAQAAVRVAGTASITEGNDTVAATAAVRVAGSASVTEADDTITATAAVRIAATASVVEANDTIVATGTVSGEVVEPPSPPPPPAFGGGDSTASDNWWRSPTGKKKRRKAQTTDTGAPIEAPLAVSDEAQRRAEELDQAMRRDAAAAATIRELERQRLEALIAEDELVLLLAA